MASVKDPVPAALRMPLAATTAAVAASAVLGGVATTPNAGWYRSLSKPSWQPPTGAFGPVWTLLYADIAVTCAQHLADAAERGDDAEVRRFATAFGVNIALNTAWSFVFFRQHRLTAATVVAGALAVSSADLVRRVAAGSPMRSAALAPYAAWTGFATCLADAVRRRNR